MNHFGYRNGVLHAEDVALPGIAERYGTPAYVYSSATLRRHYGVMADAFPPGTLIAYALKANANLAVIATLARLGAGADVVSEGELRRALLAGVPPEKIVFSGVGKTRAEMAFALTCGGGLGIHQFNVESEPELEALSAVASALGRTAPVAIRVNPDVVPGTHAKISTGQYESKFGIPWERARDAYALAARLPGIAAVGVDVHIGSQITSLTPFEAAFRRVAELVAVLRADGHAISRADLGGGLGVPYTDAITPPAPADYGAMVSRVTRGLDLDLIVEPGRLIAANAGILLTRVLYAKTGGTKRYAIVDAAMNDLIRPTLYDAHHAIVPVHETVAKRGLQRVDVVGPVCETGDYLAIDRDLPALEAGDLLAILTAGAYGAVLASTYNTRRLVPEVLVNGDDAALVRRRPEYEDLFALEAFPHWLS